MRTKAISVLTANTLAFTVCFAVWMMYGVLITFLVNEQVYMFTKSQMGWLIGIPVLTGSIFRLPAGMLADRYGGRIVYVVVMLFSALSVYLTSYADSFWGFFSGGLAFGVVGTSFAVGIAYTAVWFPPHQQGTALGIFGVGNAGAAVTALAAPGILGILTRGGEELERWRMLPRMYAVALVAVTVLFWFITFPKKPDEPVRRTLRQRLAPLKSVRVWRFGLYYFLVFGGFVALSQWLIPYYVNAYALTIVTAGLLSSVFSLPSGVIRAFGGWLSDRLGARIVMYWVLGGTSLACFLLMVPRMDIESPGEGVMAARAGTVTSVTADAIEVDGTRYQLIAREEQATDREGTIILPTTSSWQEPVVQPGDAVGRRGLLARGVTHIYFQANIVIFTALVFIIGILMGIGKAAVYKHIPEYYPNDVGTVGGIVGVLGGLGGFTGPILFGYLLDWTGVWTTSWVFLFIVSTVCLVWMHSVIRRMMNARAPDVAGHIEDWGTPFPLPLRVRCPVHGVDARVRVMVTAPHSETSALQECSLHPDHAGGPPCEGLCVLVDTEATDSAVAASR